MKTLVIMISIGPRHHFSKYSVPRASAWALRHGYSFIVITEPVQPEGMPPYYAKLAAAQLFPQYDRYCIIDDDILVRKGAPVLPFVPEGHVGIARDAVQTNTTATIVQWTGNSGFLVFDKKAFVWLDEALAHGDEPSVWGGWGDGGALNLVLWRANRCHEISKKWNFAPVLEYFMRGVGWEAWSASRFLRAWYFFDLFANPFSKSRKEIKDSWGIHLIRVRFIAGFEWLVP